jgi:hypothetical protein
LGPARPPNRLAVQGPDGATPSRAATACAVAPGLDARRSGGDGAPHPATTTWRWRSASSMMCAPNSLPRKVMPRGGAGSVSRTSDASRSSSTKPRRAPNATPGITLPCAQKACALSSRLLAAATSLSVAASLPASLASDWALAVGALLAAANPHAAASSARLKCGAFMVLLVSRSRPFHSTRMPRHADVAPGSPHRQKRNGYTARTAVSKIGHLSRREARASQCERVTTLGRARPIPRANVTCSSHR